MSADHQPRRPQAVESPFGRGPMAGFGMPVRKAKDFTGTVGRLFGYVRPYRVALGAVVAASVLSTLFGVAGPKILGQATTIIFDGYLARQRGVPGAAIDFGAVASILGTLVVLYLISALFQYVQQHLMAGVAQRTVYALRRDVEAKLARLPLRFYDARTHGEILSRGVNDIDSISSTLQQNLTQLITSLLTLVGVVTMMLTISGILTLVVVLTLPLSLVAVMRVAKRSQRHFSRQQTALGALNGHVAEMYAGHTIVSVFGHQAQSVATFTRLNDEYYDGAWRAQFISGIIMPTMMFVGNLGYVLVAVFGGVLVARQSIAIGDVQAFIQYARQFSMPLTQLSSIVNTLQLTVVSAERVFELLDEAEETPDDPSAVPPIAPRGEVRFDHVAFQYTPEVPLLEDLTIDVAAGQTVAIVGPTGAGKTTLVNLLLRFYDVTGGAIRVDGADVRSVRRGDLRRLFGMVLQDTWLFSGTIKENIAYGGHGASDDAVVAAARAAQADHFIRTLPENYDTMISEEASNLSEGQKQLLTIARAFLADPAILVLDEATSNVDTRTEVLIQEAMGQLMKGRTTFVIAHRLSTIRNADVVLMMEHGRIVEQGTHQELVARGGRYAGLYRSQFSGQSASVA